MNGMRQLTWEIGGEFHWPGLPQRPLLTWPEPHVWFALGRQVVIEIWRKHSREGAGTTLWVPDYFCPVIRCSWELAGIDVRSYSDNPILACPNWDTMRPAPGDLVLAVNYFGVREGKAWQEWYKEQECIILIEDHTHDPFSSWAVNSEADYVFVSVRKTFPVPDGGLLWSPKKKHALAQRPLRKNWTGSALKFAAMVLKKKYLYSFLGMTPVKSAFRRLQVRGEKVLSESEGLSLSPWSCFFLEPGFPKRWRYRREENVRRFLELTTNAKDFEALFTSWPEGHCPFNAVLVFPFGELRDRYRDQLISQDVYAQIHWILDPDTAPYALDLSRRILTIPLDQRYGPEDVDRIASMLMTLQPY